MPKTFSIIVICLLLAVGGFATDAAAEEGSDWSCIDGSTLLREEFEIIPGASGLVALYRQLTACDNYTFTQMSFLFPKQYGFVNFMSTDLTVRPIDYPPALILFNITKFSLQMMDWSLEKSDMFGLESQQHIIIEDKKTVLQALRFLEAGDFFEERRRQHYQVVLERLSEQPFLMEGDAIIGLNFGESVSERQEGLVAYCFVWSDIASIAYEEVMNSKVFNRCIRDRG